MKPIINRKARYHYAVLEEWEAGIVLSGQEVKSIKTGHADISSAYVSISNDEVFLVNASIPRYQFAAPDENYQPDRPRKLLLKKKEIIALKTKLTQKGLTLIALKLYTTKSRIKVLIALAKGKSRLDKREAIKEREAGRKIAQALRQKNR